MERSGLNLKSPDSPLLGQAGREVREVSLKENVFEKAMESHDWKDPEISLL